MSEVKVTRRPSSAIGATPVTLCCRNLNYYTEVCHGCSVAKCGCVKERKQLLKDINLIAKPGQLLAVVGPSGAGKTTFLNAIAQRATGNFTWTGDVLFNGASVSKREVGKLVSYLMVEGRLLPYLTVQETLLIAAKLKLPNMSLSDRQGRVDLIIDELGLGSCRNTYIGGEWKKGLSSGEKKRVDLAIELLDEPSVVLLDEPTSGLDSTLACELITLLKRVAATGRTVICSVQQPRSQIWALFDQILLISKGRTVYAGPASAAKSYFADIGYACPSNYNPADFFLNLIADPDIQPTSGPDSVSSRDTSLRDSSGTDAAVEAVEEGSVFDDYSNTFDRESSHFDKPPAVTVGSKVDVLAGKHRRVHHISRYHARPTVEELTAAFSKSPLGANLSREVNELAVESAGKHAESNKANAVQNKAMRRHASFWIEIAALTKRFFLNSIRNPVVCCVILLVQAVQALILGGIFFQLQRDAQGIEPVDLNTTKLVNNEWSQVFINGIDGEGWQPVLDAFDNGVDGKGSQPVLDPLSDSNNAEWFTRIGLCAFHSSKLEADPTGFLSELYPETDFEPSLVTDDQFCNGTAIRAIYDKDSNKSATFWDVMPAQRGYTDILRYSQFLDYFYMKKPFYKYHNMTAPGSATPIPQTFWINLQSDMSTDLMNPFMTANGFPPFLMNDGSASAKVQSISFGETNRKLTVDLEVIRQARSTAEAERARRRKAGEALTLPPPAEQQQQQAFESEVRSSAQKTGGEEQRDVTSVRKLQLVYLQGARKRKLITVANMEEIIDAVLDVIGDKATEFKRITLDMVDTMRICGTAVCDWVNDKYTSVVDTGSDMYAAAMAVIDILGCLFFLVADLGFCSYDALLTFPQERILFNRETANKLYRPISFYLAKNVADLPFQLIPSLLLTTVFYWMVGLAASAGQFFTYLVICCCTTFAAYGFGYFLSAASPRMEIATVIAPVMLCLFLVLAGFFMRDSDVPAWISWLKYLNFYRYAFAALTANQFPLNGYFGNVPNSVALIMSGIADYTAWHSILEIIALGLLYRILGYFCLLYTNRTVGLI